MRKIKRILSKWFLKLGRYFVALSFRIVDQPSGTYLVITAGMNLAEGDCVKIGKDDRAYKIAVKS